MSSFIHVITTKGIEVPFIRYTTFSGVYKFGQDPFVIGWLLREVSDGVWMLRRSVEQGSRWAAADSSVANLWRASHAEFRVFPSKEAAEMWLMHRGI